MPTRLGVVHYLNTLPLIEGLEKLPDLELIPAPPAQLADALIAGHTDLALVSVVDALRPSQHPISDPRPQTPDPRPHLTLLPVGMIASDGPTMTVRLVSRVPIREITSLTADDESHTSVALCRIILAELYAVEPTIQPRKAAEWLDDPTARRSVESALLIGDKVVNSPPLDDFPHQLDLGEQWKRLTGLPFVYAMWACRSGEELSEPVQRAAGLLDRQVRRNQTRLSWLVQTRAQAFGWPEALAHRYVCDLLRFCVDERAIEGLMAFWDRCKALGLGTAPRVAYEWFDKPGLVAR